MSAAIQAAASAPGWLDRPAVLKALAGLALLALWEIVVRGLPPAYVATPTGIAGALPGVLADATFWRQAGITLGAVLEGLAIALVLGTVVGLALGRSRVLEQLSLVYVSGLYAMPMIAILPLITAWFGYSAAARIATIVFAAFFSIALNARDGARTVPPEHLEVARAYRAGARAIWFGVVLPAALPYLVAGVRLAAGRALIGAIVAEFVISIDGLGFFILFNSRTFHHNAAMVGVLALVAFGVGFDAAVGALTRRMRWYRRDERPE